MLVLSRVWEKGKHINAEEHCGGKKNFNKLGDFTRNYSAFEVQCYGMIGRKPNMNWVFIVKKKTHCITVIRCWWLNNETESLFTFSQWNAGRPNELEQKPIGIWKLHNSLLFSILLSAGHEEEIEIYRVMFGKHGHFYNNVVLSCDGNDEHYHWQIGTTNNKNIDPTEVATAQTNR